jgi:hypothetical protein
MQDDQDRHDAWRRRRPLYWLGVGVCAAAVARGAWVSWVLGRGDPLVEVGVPALALAAALALYRLRASRS